MQKIRGSLQTVIIRWKKTVLLLQAVQPSMISAWLNLVTSEPRAAQLMNDKNPVLNSLEQAFNRYLKSVGKTSYMPDKR